MPGQVLSCRNASARSCPRINVPVRSCPPSGAPGPVLSPYQRSRPGPVPVSMFRPGPVSRPARPRSPARRAPAFTVLPPGLSRPALPAARYPSWALFVPVAPRAPGRALWPAGQAPAAVRS